jgi:hypothetical protein
MHIAGYGTESVVREVQSLIDKQQCACKIVYHGCLFGDEYEDLLKLCSIGLCPRQLEDGLSDYTFPSKIFMYLSRNLKVICTPISCVKKSPLSKIISFAPNNTPSSIAETIMNIPDTEITDNCQYLKELDIRFRLDLGRLIRNVSKLFPNS